MSKVTIHRLVDEILRNAATSHPDVQQYGFGENYELSPDGGSVPPTVWVDLPINSSSQFTNGYPSEREYTITIFVIDKSMEGETDELAILSKTDLIAAWIATYLLQNHEDDLTVIDVQTSTKTDYHSDDWTGVLMELKIRTEWPIEGCDPKAAVV